MRSGRFVRVPVEFADRELHSWMEPSAWREAYVWMQRHRSVTGHLVDFGTRKVRLGKNQLFVSTTILQQAVPELSDKAARTLLDRLEHERLISYPRGRRKGAREQIVELLDPWAGEVLVEKGRGSRSRKPTADSDLQQGNPPSGRASSPKRARSGSKTDQASGPGATLKNGQRPVLPPDFSAGTMVFGRTRPGGETRGGVTPPEETANAVSPAPPDRDGEARLLRFAEAYCAPLDRQGVLELSRTERHDLRRLVRELREAFDDDAVRAWFIGARRWADEEARADRINANFIRANTPRIRRYLDQSREGEESRRRLEQESNERVAAQKRYEAMLRWTENMRPRFDGLDPARQEELRKQASAELEWTEGVDLEDKDSPVAPAARMAIRARSLELLARELGIEVPPPP